MIEEPYRWVEVTADQCPPSDSFSTSTPPAGRNGDDVSKRREHFVEGTVVRPKSLVLFLGFASIVVAVFQTGDWLLDIWNFFSHR